ncbi:MAG: hypothetical protein LBU61_02585 [Coriobacteriales bacterium]|jgi:hypothetical protein|nr:hypothetical protein [Coriobacteriales bacterium]
MDENQEYQFDLEELLAELLSDESWESDPAFREMIANGLKATILGAF